MDDLMYSIDKLVFQSTWKFSGDNHSKGTLTYDTTESFLPITFAITSLIFTLFVVVCHAGK
jgi:hypothetical protein